MKSIVFTVGFKSYSPGDVVDLPEKEANYYLSLCVAREDKDNSDCNCGKCADCGDGSNNKSKIDQNAIEYGKKTNKKK